MAPAVGAGGDAVVPSARGAAKLGLRVLGGRVERRLCLCRAAPAEVGGPSLALCFPGPGEEGGVPHSAFLHTGRCFRATQRCSSSSKSSSEFFFFFFTFPFGRIDVKHVKPGWDCYPKFKAL